MIITLITATYNSYPNIQDTIQCIQEQTHKNIEFIVVDGGSNDQTIDAVKESSIVSRYISEPDKGIYDALNKGVKMASGDIIGFVHSDDLLASPDILEKISKLFETKNVDGVYGDLLYVDKDDTNKTIRYWKSKPFTPGLLKKGWMPAHPTLFLKREVYEKHGLFNLDYQIAADYDFMLRILQDNELKFAYLPKIITKMRIGGASNRSLKNILQKSTEDYKAIKKNKIGFAPLVLFSKNISKLPQFFKK